MAGFTDLLVNWSVIVLYPHSRIAKIEPLRGGCVNGAGVWLYRATPPQLWLGTSVFAFSHRAVGIRVRTFPQYPFLVVRHLQRNVIKRPFRVTTQIHRRCGTIKIPPSFKTVSSEKMSIFTSSDVSVLINGMLSSSA